MGKEINKEVDGTEKTESVEEGYFEENEDLLIKTNRNCKIILIIINILFIVVHYLIEISFGTPINIDGTSAINWFIPRVIVLSFTIFNYIILFPFLLSKKTKNYDIKPLILIAYTILVVILYIWILMFTLNFKLNTIL